MKKIVYFVVFLLVILIGVEFYYYISYQNTQKDPIPSLDSNTTLPSDSVNPTQSKMLLDKPEYQQLFNVLSKNVELQEAGAITSLKAQTTYVLTIQSISDPTENGSVTIEFLVKDKTYTSILSPEDLSVTTFYAETESGNQPITIKDLKPGDVVRYYTEEENVYAPNYKILKIEITKL